MINQYNKKLLWLIISILSFNYAFAVTIGVSPGVMQFNNMVREGYAENYAMISTNSPVELEGHFEIQEGMEDWIEFEPSSLKYTVSSQKPYSFKIIARPPSDATNGNYTLILRILTDTIATTESGAGSSIIAAVGLRINIEVTDQEIVLCRAGAISTSSSEIGEPFGVSGTVWNDGNVRLRPTFYIEVWDQLQQQILMTHTFKGREDILPTTNRRVYQDIENSLPIGQYFAEVTVKECGIVKTTSFDIVEKGGIFDSGEFIGIRSNEYAYVHQPTQIIPVFRNTGSRNVVARFRGQITRLDSNSIVQTLESDELQVIPGNTIEFPMYFTPDSVGKYQVGGRITYNKKITFEDKSKVINVVKSSGQPIQFSIVLIAILYVVIGLVIIILIGLIRKGRKKKRRF